MKISLILLILALPLVSAFQIVAFPDLVDVGYENAKVLTNYTNENNISQVIFLGDISNGGSNRADIDNIFSSLNSSYIVSLGNDDMGKENLNGVNLSNNPNYTKIESSGYILQDFNGTKIGFMALEYDLHADSFLVYSQAKSVIESNLDYQWIISIHRYRALHIN